MTPPDTPLTVLMLGWEFPPFITGGLGTACHGLTRALDRHGTRVIFLHPKWGQGTLIELVEHPAGGTGH